MQAPRFLASTEHAFHRTQMTRDTGRAQPDGRVRFIFARASST